MIHAPVKVNGEHYHFVSVEEALRHKLSNNALYEYAEVFGNYYGTSEISIDAQLAQGIDVFLDIDWQGAQQVRKKKPDGKHHFYLHHHHEQALESRLRGRGQDSDEVIAQSNGASTKLSVRTLKNLTTSLLMTILIKRLAELATIVNNQRLKRN